MEPKDLAKLQNDARTTLVQAFGGVVLLIGLYFTLRNLQLTQDRQITEHYTRAVEQLGSERLEIRLGAIYALERIARDSERDHWPIMEILTAYVREHAPWKAEEEEDHSQKEIPPSERPLKWTSIPLPNGMFLGRQNEPRPALAVDIQAILTVLGRRTRTYEKGEDERLNLQYTTLRGAILKEAQLQGAMLAYIQLQRADLEGAQLQRAHLVGAQLQRANLDCAELQEADLWDAILERATLVVAQLQNAFLIGTRLQRADLRGAQLQGAHLIDAELQGALLLDTQLQGADLSGANLTGARGLTIEQLSTVRSLCEAVLDPPLREQIARQYPHLLEPPPDEEMS